jgi:flagellin
MAVINTNINALAAQGSLSNVQKKQQTAMERLSTGLRINSAADDAAGLAITNRMTSQIRGYAVAIRNSNDGISMAQTTEGALGNIGDMLQRMRELAVQSANGSNSAENRQAIQAEVSQLKDQINNIAKQTNFNDIKLLDGSAGNIVLQTGVNQNETMKMKFDSAQTKDLGLNTPAALTSVGGISATALSEGDLIINGVTVAPTFAKYDTLSSGSNNSSSIAKATAINLVSDKTNVVASVNVNTVYGNTAVMTTTANSSTGTVTINGVTTSSFSLGTSGSTSVARQATVQAINQISAQTGVTAIDNGDDYHGVSLVAADGRNIIVGSYGGSMTAEITGLGATGTYVGTYSLQSTSGGSISISSKIGGTLANSGLIAGTFDGNTATTVTRARAGATSSAFQALTGDALQINGVTVGAAVATDDLATYSTTAGTKVSSAIATAAAINKVTSLTGVTAKANANVLVGSGFVAAAGDASSAVNAMTLNGVTISVTYSANLTRQNLADVINLAQGQTGVKATDNGSGLTLTADDGRSISIAASTGGSAASAASLGLDSMIANGVSAAYTAASASSTTPTSYVSTVSLTSSNPFVINSASSGNSKLASLGFTSGTFGGSPNSLSVDKLDVTTTSGAMTAIASVDAAIKQVSLQQAKAGAYQNRLDSVVSNLTESNQNMNASRSRILDTDYANETTNLAKSQIISQAATAMLAQANQSGQSVLALLK